MSDDKYVSEENKKFEAVELIMKTLKSFTKEDATEIVNDIVDYFD